MHFLSISLLFLSIFTIHARDITFDMDNPNELLSNQIAQENGKTLFAANASSGEEDTFNSVISGDKKFSEILELTLQHHLKPKLESKRRSSFDLFALHETHCGDYKNNVLDQISWQDLEIVCGPKEHLDHYIAKKIDRTKTELGRFRFFETIINPTDSCRKRSFTPRNSRTINYSSRNRRLPIFLLARRYF